MDQQERRPTAGDRGPELDESPAVDLHDELTDAICRLTPTWLEWLVSLGIPRHVIFAEPLRIGLAKAQTWGEVLELPTRGAGRPKGSRNKNKKEVAQVFDPVARRMTKKLEARFNEELEKGDCNLDFCQKLYTLACSYAWGQPVKRSEVSGPDGGPQEIVQHRIEAAARVAEVFGQVASDPEDDVAQKLDDDSLRAVSAVSFLQAQREAAPGRPVAPSTPAGASCAVSGDAT